MNLEPARVVALREIRTVARTRAYLALALAFAAVTLGIAWAGGSAQAGYVPTMTDLLTPFELVVPVLAVAFGYRAIVEDAERGELETMRTYPVTDWQTVLGVYAGRLVGVVAAIVVPLVIVTILVAVAPPTGTRILASHEGADSAILFVRFGVLTVAYAATVLAVAIAISAVAASARSGLALATVAVLVLVVGIDVVLLGQFGSNRLPAGSLLDTLALSPASAYRGLVLETAIGAVVAQRFAAPLSSVLGLIGWTAVSLLVAVYRLHRS